MANELECITGQTGQTITASLISGGAVVTSGIACPEIEGAGGVYQGNMIGAAGHYTIVFYEGSQIIGGADIDWNGTAEITGINGDGTGGTIQNNVVIPAAVAVGSLTPSLITVQNYCSLAITLPPMGVLTGRSDLRFSIKHSLSDPDSAALLTISELGGLITANGAPAANSSLATLTVANASTTGDVTLFVDASIMGLLAPTNGVRDLRFWGGKVIIGNNKTEPIGGQCVVASAVNQHV